MRRLRRTRLRLSLAAVSVAAALAPVWLGVVAMMQHPCHCGLDGGCRCELAAAPAAGGHGHCELTQSCTMGRTHAPSDNALFGGLDGRGWFAMPETREIRIAIAPAGRAAAPAAPLPRSPFLTPETPPPRSSGAVV
jgi:hypothetical protein